MKVSIVIPAFNCAKTLEKTVLSLLNQTFKDFELIIINDGSTDNTQDIISSLAKKDTRIQAVSVLNGGPAKARNVGLKMARGEYIYFMDSDDEADEKMLFTMVMLVKKQPLDMVCTGYVMETLSESGVIKSSKAFGFDNNILKSRDAISKYILPLCNSHLMYVVWNKLYKREFLLKNKLTFPDFFGGEDRLFNLNCIEKLKSLGVIKTPLYHYHIQGENSLAGRYVKDRFETALLCIKAMDKIIHEYGITNKKHIEMADFAALKQVIASITQLYANSCTLSQEEKDAEILRISRNDITVKIAHSHTSGFGYVKITKFILKTQNLFLINQFAKFILTFQRKFSAFFLKIKHSNK